jgi:hypothetical protein
VLRRLLDPVGRCLTSEVAQQLVALQVDPAVQARLEELADKCTEGQLSADERTEYETYVQALEFIAVLQTQARSLLTDATATCDGCCHPQHGPPASRKPL